MSKVHGAFTSLHTHESGAEVLAAAIKRERNTTIVISVDQQDGAMLIDIDAQAGVCADAKEMQDNLRLVIDALNGRDPLA